MNFSLTNNMLTNKTHNRQSIPQRHPINTHLTNTDNSGNIITFSTCWYVLKSKFPIATYVGWVKNMLSIVRHFNLVIYTDRQSFNHIKHLINLKNTKIKIIIKPLEEFTTYKYKDYWIQNHEKSPLHLHKEIGWELNMLWNEKVFLVNETIERQYFISHYYGWCDMGYFRNRPNDLHTTYLRNWPNSQKLLNDPFHLNRIHYGCVQDNSEKYRGLMEDITQHYDNGLSTPPTTQYDETCFAGGFFLSTTELCTEYAKLYDEKLLYYFSNDFFIKDDQSIIMDIVFTNPQLFYLHNENGNCFDVRLDHVFDPWFMFQRILL